MIRIKIYKSALFASAREALHWFEQGAAGTGAGAGGRLSQIRMSMRHPKNVPVVCFSPSAFPHGPAWPFLTRHKNLLEKTGFYVMARVVLFHVFHTRKKIKRWEVKTRSNLALAASCPWGAQEGRALLEQRRAHPSSAPGGTGMRVPSSPQCLQEPRLALGPGPAWGHLLGLNHKPESRRGGEIKIKVY